MNVELTLESKRYMILSELIMYITVVANVAQELNLMMQVLTMFDTRIDCSVNSCSGEKMAYAVFAELESCPTHVVLCSCYVCFSYRSILWHLLFMTIKLCG